MEIFNTLFQEVCIVRQELEQKGKLRVAKIKIAMQPTFWQELRRGMTVKNATYLYYNPIKAKYYLFEAEVVVDRGLQQTHLIEVSYG